MGGLACDHHRHYRAGCPACQRVGSHYDRRRRAAIKAGTWQPPVPLAKIRDHIEALRAKGMSLTAIAKTAGLSPNTVYGVMHNNRNAAHGPTAAAILAITTPTPTLPAGMVDATGTTRRIQALVATGYSLSDIARRLDRIMQQIWELAWHRQPTVTQATARAVADLYDKLSATPGPSTRARNDGQRRGWHPPLAWDDDTIDDPAAEPCIAPVFDEPVIDEVAIERVLHGRARFTTLDDPARYALVAQLAGKGLTRGQIGRRLGINTDTARKYLPAGHPGRDEDQDQEVAA